MYIGGFLLIWGFFRDEDFSLHIWVYSTVVCEAAFFPEDISESLAFSQNLAGKKAGVADYRVAGVIKIFPDYFGAGGNPGSLADKSESLDIYLY